MARPSIAIIDDYQQVALTLADWSAVEARANSPRSTALGATKMKSPPPSLPSTSSS